MQPVTPKSGALHVNYHIYSQLESDQQVICERSRIDLKERGSVTLLFPVNFPGRLPHRKSNEGKKLCNRTCGKIEPMESDGRKAHFKRLRWHS
jgi:hypothetical protein